LYERVLEVAEHDRELFSVPLARRLEMPLATMQEWLKSSREIVNVMARRQRERLEGRQPDIREAMTPVSEADAEWRKIRREAKRTRQQEVAATKAADKAEEEKRLVKDEEEAEAIRQTAVEKGKKRAGAERASLVAVLMSAARRRAKNKQAERTKKKAESKEGATLAAKTTATKKRTRQEMGGQKASKQMQHWMVRVGAGHKPKFRNTSAGSTHEQQAENDQSHVPSETSSNMQQEALPLSQVGLT
jgi:membrane protein involved in colicin uptake